MSKELEALEIIGKLYLIDDEQVKDWDKRNFNILKSALQRLEAIDNSNPSEALKYWENMQSRIASNISTIEYTTIKQALMKQLSGSQYHNIIIDEAQEPKQYLKWEDLEFKEETQKMNVKMGDNIYYIEWFNRNYKVVNFYTNLDDNTLHYTSYVSEEHKQFFNDLHLEAIEE